MALALPSLLAHSSPPAGRDADRLYWRRALTVSVTLHGLILGMVAQQHWQEAARVPDALLQVVLSRSAASAARAAEEPPPPSRAVRANRAPDAFRASQASPLAPGLPERPIAEDSAPAIPTIVAEPAPSPAPVHLASRGPTEASPLAGFNRLLSQTVERHKHYPRIALVRHWQGTAVLKVNIGADGRLRNYLLMSSSGYDALDQQALEMLREALPLPELPAQLAGLDLSIDVPVTFRIAD